MEGQAGMTGDFIRHEPCPKCDSKDNLAVYSDGHKYCFGCLYYEPGDRLASLLTKPPHQEARGNGGIPHERDWRSLSPLFEESWGWIRKYGITVDEVQEHRLIWWPERRWLIVPIYNEERELIFYQARNFSNEGPKYLTKGKSEGVFALLDRNRDPGNVGIVVVEDFLSAIKVGRVTAAMPLWGSSISDQRMKRLRNLGFKNLTIWLDCDKGKEAAKFCQRAFLFFNRAGTIITQKDPKCYSTEEIGNFLK